MRNINYNEVKRGEALGLIMRNCVVMLLLFYYLRLATAISMLMRLEGYCLCLFLLMRFEAIMHMCCVFETIICSVFICD